MCATGKTPMKNLYIKFLHRVLTQYIVPCFLLVQNNTLTMWTLDTKQKKEKTRKEKRVRTTFGDLALRKQKFSSTVTTLDATYFNRNIN